MALINRGIPNLYNGISQQSPSVRHASQAEVQENMQSSIVDGLHKRPPLELVANITSYTDDDYGLPEESKTYKAPVTTHFFNRDETIKELLSFRIYGTWPSGFLMANQGRSVITETNAVLISNGYTNAYKYLGSTDLQSNLVFLTVADTVFVLNKAVVPAMKSTTTGGTLKGTKQRFSDLPATGNTAGDVWEIAGDNTNQFDNYYVKWDGASWRESARPGISFEIDPTTMPHTLTRNPSTGAWVLNSISWSVRSVGDDASAQIPSFIGKTLNDIFFFRNRLGFLADENVIMSAAGDYFRFFPSSVTTVLADDPIDVSVNHPKISVLNHAVPFNNTLLLFSDFTQFQLEGGETLSPSTVKVVQTTEFECARTAKPVAAGTNVYFASNKTQHSSIKEYFAQEFVAGNDADDITAHAQSYVPKDIHKIISANNEDTLFFLTKDEPNAIYVYKYYWKGDEKIQSSWSKWVLPAHYSIVNGAVMDDELYLSIVVDLNAAEAKKAQLSVYKIRLQPGLTDSTLSDRMYLDFLSNAYKKDYTSTPEPQTTFYASEAGYLTSIKYNKMPPDLAVLPKFYKDSSWGAEAWQEIPNPEYDATNQCFKVIVSGDHQDKDLLVGIPYTAKYEFSPQYAKDSEDRSIAKASFHIRRGHLFFHKTGYFKVKVITASGVTYTYTFDADALVGNTGLLNIENGSFQFPIMGRGDVTRIIIESDHWKPCYFQSAELEAFVQMRSRRI